MNSDFYSEQLVTKKQSGGDTAKKVLAGIGTAAVAALVFLITFILFPVNLVLVGFVFYGGYYLMTGFDTEYEYIITNGDLDIDKISGKRKRKRLLSTKIEDFTAFGKLSEASEAQNGVTTVLVTDGTDENAYYADLKHQSAGNVRLIFTPDEKTLEGVTMFLPRQLKVEQMKKRFEK